MPVLSSRIEEGPQEAGIKAEEASKIALLRSVVEDLTVPPCTRLKRRTFDVDSAKTSKDTVNSDTE